MSYDTKSPSKGTMETDIGTLYDSDDEPKKKWKAFTNINVLKWTVQDGYLHEQLNEV